MAERAHAEARRAGWLLMGAVLLGGTAVYAAVPGSMPARPSTATATKPATLPATKPVNALQADALLSAFPRNAAAISARSDARAMTLEGRVRDVRKVVVTKPGTAGGTEVRVVMVGKAQAEDFAPHFTCHMDSATAVEAAKLEPDAIIRVTGALGQVSAAQDRIDLLDCHDLTVIGEMTLAQRVIGKWIGSGRPDATAPAEIRGKTLRLEMQFAADNTFSEEVFDGTQSLRKITGKWSTPKPKEGEDPVLRVEPKNLLSSELPVGVDAGRLVFQPPGLADMKLAKVTFSRTTASELAYDPRAMGNQVMQWFGTNVNAPNSPNLATSVSSFIAQQGDGSYTFLIGGGHFATNRPVQLTVCEGKMFVFPFNDAQARRANAQPRAIAFGTMPPSGVLMVPEAKIESLVLDGKTTLSASKPLTGKVAFRTLGRQMELQYVLVMASVHGTMTWRMDKTPGPDVDTFDFSFDISRTGGGMWADPDPLPLFFAIGRIPAPDDRSPDRRPRIISEPMGFLMDIAK